MKERKGGIQPYLYVFLAFLQAGLTSGIIFGWPSLQTIFEQEGVYRDHCDSDDKVPCKEQSIFFERVYTVGIFANNGAPLLTGFFLDHFGPKLTNLVSVSFFILGCGLFAIPDALVKIPAFALLGFAGPGVYCSIMHLCNLFPGNQSMVLSFFSGTFSVSSFVFKVFLMMHESTSRLFNLRGLFLEYIVLLVPFFILSFFVWPNKAFEAAEKTSAPDSATVEEEQSPLLHPSEKEITTQKKIKLSLYNASVSKQFKSPLYWFAVFWIALENLHVAAYMGTVKDRFPGTDMPSVFSWIWTFGFIAIPFFGYMLDRKGITASIFVATVGLAFFSALKLIPIINLQYLSFVLISVVNVGMWGIFYSFLSAKFGFDNFGKLLGVMCVTVAVIGLLQYPLATLTIQYLNGNYHYMDVFFVCTSALTFACPFYLWDAERKELTTQYIEHFPINPGEN